MRVGHLNLKYPLNHQYFVIIYRTRKVMYLNILKFWSYATYLGILGVKTDIYLENNKNIEKYFIYQKLFRI